VWRGVGGGEGEVGWSEGYVISPGSFALTHAPTLFLPCFAQPCGPWTLGT
jgi:hypothetical protein